MAQRYTDGGMQFAQTNTPYITRFVNEYFTALGVPHVSPFSNQLTVWTTSDLYTFDDYEDLYDEELSDTGLAEVPTSPTDIE